MKRYGCTVYLSVDELKIILIYAEQAGVSLSEYMRHSGLSEGKRHLPKKRLEALIRDCIKEVLDNRIPVPGEGNGGEQKG